MTWACRDGCDGASLELHEDKPIQATDDDGNVSYFGGGDWTDVPDWVIAPRVVKPGECVEVSVICGPMPHITIMVPKELPSITLANECELTFQRPTIIGELVAAGAFTMCDPERTATIGSMVQRLSPTFIKAIRDAEEDARLTPQLSPTDPQHPSPSSSS